MRVAVRGTVTMAGGERPTGSITFVPADGHSGPAATTTLSDGGYRFDRSNGPTTGPHVVIVRRAIPKRKLLATRNESKPPRANPAAAESGKTEWTFHSDVTDEGATPSDFTLSP